MNCGPESKQVHKQILVAFLAINLVSFSVQAEYVLTDKICAIVDNEQPILQSEVERKSQEINLDRNLALEELIHERALRIYGRQLKFSSTDTNKAAEEHIQSIVKKNNLSWEKFKEILRQKPYLTTIQQYQYEIAFQILKNNLEASFINSINISDKDVEAASSELFRNKKTMFEVMVISILPDGKTTLTGLLNKAKKLRNDFLSAKNINSVKQKYRAHKNISFSEPDDYQEGNLKHDYEMLLKKTSSNITEPFVNGQAVSMIVKLEKKTSDKGRDALENIQKDLYKKAVEQRLHAVTKDLLINVPVEVNCAW